MGHKPQNDGSKVDLHKRPPQFTASSIYLATFLFEGHSLAVIDIEELFEDETQTWLASYQEMRRQGQIMAAEGILLPSLPAHEFPSTSFVNGMGPWACVSENLTPITTK